MSTLRNKLILLAAVAILTVVGSLMNSRKANAQGGGPVVTIGAPLPVPVTGSVTSTVTGTVGLASGASVSVNNTVTDPVRVRNVNDAVQPFQGAGACTVPAHAATICHQNIFFVPTGKRAVIEYFSGQANNISVGQVNPLITTTVGSFEVNHSLPVTPAQSPFPSWGQQVRLYADSGTYIKGFASIDLQSADILVTFSVSGYLVDVPFTP
jgi:hypothetical protein